MESILKIIAYGAWNGGTAVDNSIFENTGMFFKGGIPVNNETIEKRVGVRTRIIAPPDERIGVTALNDLFETSDIDPSRVRLIVGATNAGDDKHDPGPLIRYPFETIRRHCPDAMVFDLYAGCPGFNVTVELIFMLSLTGILQKGDISVVVGAENLHRAKIFTPLDTSNIIFGDDALATGLETGTSTKPRGGDLTVSDAECTLGDDFITDTAKKLIDLIGDKRIDGIILDNQLGKTVYKIPATAARVQHKMVELMVPEEVSRGTFKRFRDALTFYDENVKSFAFDIMSLDGNPAMVKKIARAYVESGKYESVVSIYLTPDMKAELTFFEGKDFIFEKPQQDIVDTLTRTHGCFGDYIQALTDNGDVFGEIDGKGVFLHATRGAKTHLTELLSGNNLTMDDIDLLIEHQANFAMIPLTLEKILADSRPDVKEAVSEYIANRMITNIHERGNCSVVCMQRLPYDLQRDALKEDTIQGFPVNRNLENLKHARVVLSDSIGTGMTRSSVLQIKK